VGLQLIHASLATSSNVVRSMWEGLDRNRILEEGSRLERNIKGHSRKPDWGLVIC
jgi:hypothetical protein